MPDRRGPHERWRISDEEAKDWRTRHQATLNPKPDAGDVSCSAQKSWHKEVMTKILERGKVLWPWGYARCTGEVTFDRATRAKSSRFQKDGFRCKLEGGTATYEVKLQIQPKVTFKQGKAVKASLNWGKIAAPKFAKRALWSAAAADDAFRVWQSRVVDGINEFVHSR